VDRFVFVYFYVFVFVGRFGGLVDAGAIIQLVAKDSEERGLLEDAVRLYDLASRHERVVELLNSLLSQVSTVGALHKSGRCQFSASVRCWKCYVSGVWILGV
jgi:hypothetical protein